MRESSSFRVIEKKKHTDHFEFGRVARAAGSVVPMTSVHTGVTSTNAVNCQNAGPFAQFRYTYIHVRSDRLIVKRPE